MKTFFKTILVYIITKQATLLLKKHNPTIIAVTGSVGKTATKDAIYTVLKNHCSVRKSEKSFNSEIGVPLTILGLSNAWSSPVGWAKNCMQGFLTVLFSKEYPDILVLETGVDTKGDMARLTSWLKPDIVVLTRLPDVPVHVEFFDSPEQVVEEKMQLVYALRTDGVLVYNNDDLIIRAQLEKVLQKTISYGRYSDCQYRIKADKTVYHDDLPHGLEFTIETDDDTYDIRLTNTLGMQLAYIYTPAFAVGEYLGVPAETMLKAIEKAKPTPSRMRIVKGIKGTTLIDDSYNASPVAVESAIHTLNELKYTGRKIAVLGDMLELGKYSVEQHHKIGTLLPGKVDMLIAVGVRAKGFANAALEHGMPEKNILQYENADRAGRELQNLMQVGDVILIKGSQSIRMEKIVEEVMQEPERAEELLCRQDAEWKRR